MEHQVTHPYPHWILSRLTAGESLDQVLTALSQWVEDQIPGGVCSFLQGPDLAQASVAHFHAPPPSRLPRHSVECLNQLGWIQVSQQIQLGWEQPLSVLSLRVQAEPGDVDLKAWGGRWLPLSVGPCQLLGLMGIYTPEPGDWGSEQEQVIEWARSLASIALHQAALHHRCQQLEAERDQAYTTQAQLQAILDNAPMGIVVKDRQHRYVMVNRHKERTLALPRHQILGKTEYDFFPPDVAATLQAHDQQVIERGESVQFEETTVIATGERCHTLSIKFPIYEAPGQIMGMGGIFVNITERKQQEEHLRMLQQAIQACGNGVVITDALVPDYPVVYVNPAFEQLTGYTQAEFLGKNCRLLQRSDRDQPEIQQIRVALAAGQDCRVTLRNYRKDGTPFWNELYLSPVRDQEGRLTHYIGIQTDASQRRQAQEDLRVSEARLRTLVENVPFCVWARDKDLRLMLQNEANRQLYGNQLSSRPEESALSPYRIAQWETVMRRTLEEMVVHSESTEMIDNQPRYFHRITMSVPEATEGIKYIGIGIDITPRKQMELELDRFFRVSLDLLCITDIEGRFRRVNPAWETSLGYTQPELEGQYLLDWVHPEDRVETLETLSHLRQGSQILNFVNRYRAKDGSYRYIEWRSFPYGASIYAAARDITDRKLTELALIKSDQDLRYRIQFESLLTQISAQFITLTSDQIEAGIQTALHQILEFLDLDRVYLYSLDGDRPGISLCACSGAEPTAHCKDTLLEEIQDLRRWLEHQHSLWIPRFEDLFPEGTVERQQLQSTGIRSMALLSLSRGTQVIGAITLESHRQTRDWSPHECSLLTTFSQILSNALERRRIEQQRNEFTAIVSHELRTPLTSIRALLGLLTTGRLGSLSPQGQDLLTAALADTDRLERLVNEILDLERLRTGRIQLSHRWSSISHLLERLVQSMHPLAEQTSITLTSHTSVDQVWADPDRLLQVLTNLVGNGIKFSPPHSRIQITVSQQLDKLHWQVIDQGHGIPADKLDTIFEPFVQVNGSDARPQPGTGLGLAICRQIIHHHQGHLWVESGALGSIFAFTLPHPIP